MKQASACFVRDAGDSYQIVVVTDGITEPVIVTIGHITNLAQDCTNILAKIIRGSDTSGAAKKANGQAGKSIEKVYRHTIVNTRSLGNGRAIESAAHGQAAAAKV